jgi:hypothetical protein
VIVTVDCDSGGAECRNQGLGAAWQDGPLIHMLLMLSSPLDTIPMEFIITAASGTWSSKVTHKLVSLILC